MDSIQKVSFDNKTPDESTQKLHLIYYDFGFARVEIFASRAETFRAKMHITKIYDSLRVNFFSRDGNATSTLTALSGEINHTTGTIIVRDSVRLKNFSKKQTLETEELVWKQKDSMILSTCQVVVKSPKGYLFGSGIRVKQDFSFYEILTPKGSIQLEKELKLD